MTFDGLPIFGVCGWSGSGKTTLIEATVPWLVGRGLKVAVVKHDSHQIDVDRPGKDSDRLFRAGGDVYLANADEQLVRRHTDTEHTWEQEVVALCRRYDLVLVEGHKQSPLAKVWLLGDDEAEPPPEARDVLAVLDRKVDRVEILRALLWEWLPRRWLKTPVFGAVLIGGRSTRMGRPKHLIRSDGTTWLERTVGLLEQVTARVVILGAGQVPAGLSQIVRLADVRDAEGPMAGLLAAMRWEPAVSWLLAPCDHPDLSVEALEWLLSTRRPGLWATLPRLDSSPSVEPLLAHYDFRAAPLLESAAGGHEFSLSRIAAHAKVISPTPPAALAAAWQDVDTPA